MAMVGKITDGMTCEVKDITWGWVVWVNSDLTEGRGGEVPFAICESEATARRLAKGQDVQGTDGTVEPLPLLSVHWTRPNGLSIRRVFAPVIVTVPSTEDIKTQERIDELAEEAERFKEALERAKAAGLSDEDIESLKAGAR